MDVPDRLDEEPAPSKRKSPVTGLVALQRRVGELEDRMTAVQELEDRIGVMHRDVTLARSSMSGLSALQQIVSANQMAQGTALQMCLRFIMNKRMDARPETLTARRKRRPTVMSIDCYYTRSC